MEKPTKDLYVGPEFGTLRLGVVTTPAQCAGVARSLERVARAVRNLLYARGAVRGVSTHLLGLLSDSRRKSMSAMLERIRDPGTYQAFQHFITDAPWSAETVWRQLRATIPDRTAS